MSEDFEMHESAEGAQAAVDALSRPASLVDLRSIAQSFVLKRLSNTDTVEDIRRAALSRLQNCLNSDDSEHKLGPAALLEIVTSLSNASKEDMHAILKLQAESGSSPGAGRPGSQSPLREVFSNTQAEQEPTRIPIKAYPALDQLLRAAECVVSERSKDK